MVTSRFIHVVACMRITLVLKAESCPIVFIRSYHILLTHSSVDGYLGFCHLLAIMNNAAMNMVVQISVSVSAFKYFEYIH